MSHPVPAVSHVQEVVEEFLSALREAQQRGLAEWVNGVLAAGSGGKSAVLAALAAQGVEPQAARARLRELLCDGPERAAPCGTRLEVETCFAPLLARDPLLVGRRDAPRGQRRHQFARTRGGLEPQCPLPRQRHPRGLGGAAAPRQGGLDPPPGTAAHHLGAGGASHP